MTMFLLDHHHRPEECRAAYAAWNGFDSPLRRHAVIASCASGGHRMFWTVDAPDERAALGQLPSYVAERTSVDEVKQVPIP